MNLLLDTHVFLWLASGIRKLPGATEERLRDPNVIVFLSAVSAWEIAIKQALGKLNAPDDMHDEMARFRFDELPVTIEHALAVKELPNIHADPFDRLLIAQAKVEGLSLVTSDKNILKYDIRTLPS